MTAFFQKERGSRFPVFQCIGFLILLLPGLTSAAPRPLSAPWPSFGMLAREGFDQPYGFATNQAVDSGVWSESWSGWALNRQGTVVTLWVVPMVVSNAFRIEPERGAYRLWYRPNYSSGTGAGQPATLLTLATMQGNTELVWWSLVLAPKGNEIQLVCQTENGPQSCLQAEVNWEAGSWHLLTLGFTPTNSALFIDDQLQAVGGGLATIPIELAPATHLVVGSAVSGETPAQGQIEELAIFSGRKRMQQVMGNIFGMSVDWEIGIYYNSHAKTAALGPISEEELAARKAAAEKRKAERLALGLEEAGGGMQMRLMSGPTVECVTNSPLFITNTVAWFDANDAWTVQFDIQGTNSPADIFGTTNLSGSHITNATWVWLERGPSCATYQYTNQAGARSFYILGDATIDSDGDGLPDAYEILAAHTDPLVWNFLDADGDGLPDAWELAHGGNPQVADAGADPDADGIINLTEYQGGTRPQESEGFAIWVSQPGGNLP